MTTPAPAPTPAAPAASDGKTLGIVGVVLAFLIPLVGLIVSIVARGQSKRAGVSNGAATAGIIISIIIMVVGIIVAIVIGATAGSLLSICGDLGPGVHELNGVTYTCS
jgi:hypothetical protein